MWGEPLLYMMICVLHTYNSMFIGLFHLCKLPCLNSLVSHFPETLDLAFKLKRKKFLIEVYIIIVLINANTLSLIPSLPNLYKKIGETGDEAKYSTVQSKIFAR